MNEINIQKLLAACRALQLEGAKFSDSYYYSSLSLCLIDSVFSIGVKYSSVKRVIEHVVTKFDINRDRRKQHLDPMPLPDFVRIANVESSELFRNLQRTSTRGGILKSEAVILAATALMGVGIKTIQDFQSCGEATLGKAESAFRNVKGQKSGISWSYLRMLAGDDNQVKPDRHVLRFIEKAIGLKVTLSQATELIQKTAERLAVEFPGMTPRLLDHQIWKSESQGDREG